MENEARLRLSDVNPSSPGPHEWGLWLIFFHIYRWAVPVNFPAAGWKINVNENIINPALPGLLNENRKII
jgi:hypothetical protein